MSHSNSNSKKDSNFQKSSNVSKSETTEISIPKLTFAPTSNFHKWKKQLLKQIKKEYGPIYDSLISEKYPNFVQESMKLILATPEDILKEMMAISKVKSTRRQSISAPGHLSFKHQSERYSDDSCSDNESDYEPLAATLPRTSSHAAEADELEEPNVKLESLLKMSAEGRKPTKKRDKTPERQLTQQQIKLVDNYIMGKQKIINDLELYFIHEEPVECVCNDCCNSVRSSGNKGTTAPSVRQGLWK